MPSIVVVAIDASQAAEKAFDWYIENIHKSENKLVVLHCVDLSRLSVEGDDSEGAVEKQWSKQDNLIKTLEGKYRWKLNEIGTTGKIKTLSGKPGEVIIRVSKEEKAEMIVIGSRGLGKIQRTFAGSVSDYVLHNAHCPVIIFKESVDKAT